MEEIDNKKINVQVMHAKKINRARGRDRAGVGAAVLDR